MAGKRKGGVRGPPGILDVYRHVRFCPESKNKQAKTFLDPKLDGFSAQAHLLLR